MKLRMDVILSLFAPSARPPVIIRNCIEQQSDVSSVLRVTDSR